MTRAKARTVFIYGTALIVAVLLVRHYHSSGGPYFEFPETVLDHFSNQPNETREVIVLCKRAEFLLPRGAEVTIIRPSQAPDYLATIFLPGVGALPRQRVVSPHLGSDRPEDLPDFVLAIREPLEHPSYRLLAEFPEGKVYTIRR